MKILVSACLLGTPCRYDGKSKRHALIDELSEKHDLVPVCPEVLGGLPTPRTPSERVGERVMMQDGHDVTENYRTGAQKTLETALREGCTLAVLKARSPSCGKGEIYDGTFTKTLISRDGVTAELLAKHGIRVLTEEEILSLL